MGTDPFKKSWWFLEAHDGSWLADRDHELFTRDPNKALKWPNFTDADQARRALHQPLWHRIRAPTEHVFVDLEAPTPPPVPAVTREELVGMINRELRSYELHGVYHHASPKHLGRYVDEFAFRLNEGNVKVHTLDRLDSFIRGTAGKRLTYAELIA